MYATEVVRNPETGLFERIVVSIDRQILRNLVIGIGNKDEEEKFMFDIQYGHWFKNLSVTNGDVIDFVNTLVRDNVLAADRYIDGGDPTDSDNRYEVTSAFGFDTLMHEKYSVYSQYLLPETECEGSNLLIEECDVLTVIANHVGLFTMFLNIRKAMLILATLDETVDRYATSIFPVIRQNDGYQILNVLKTVSAVEMQVASPDGTHRYTFTAADKGVDETVSGEEHTAIGIVRDQIKAEYEIKIRAMMRNYEGQVEKLRSDLNIERTQKYSTALQFITRLYEQGWRLTDAGNHIMYPGRIYAEQILYAGKLYPVPEGLQNKFYVEGIVVPINNTITGACACGFYPHVERQLTNDTTPLCIGGLAHQPFDQILDLVGNLKTINVHSMFGNAASAAIYCMTGTRPGSYYGQGGKVLVSDAYIASILTVAHDRYFNYLTNQVAGNSADAGEVFHVDGDEE